MRFPPSSIEVILFHYYTPEPFPRRQTSAYQSALHEFLEAGLLKLTAQSETESGVVVTPKGQAWVEMICRTPFPEEKRIWADPRTGKEVNLHDS